MFWDFDSTIFSLQKSKIAWKTREELKKRVKSRMMKDKSLIADDNYVEERWITNEKD